MKKFQLFPFSSFVKSLGLIVCLVLVNAATFAQDGANDYTFNSCLHGNGANGSIETTAIQSDGKILIGGEFTSYHGIAINHIARLNVDGTLDVTFNVGIGTNDVVNVITKQSNGKLIIGGAFTSYNGQTTNRITRLNIDGTLDETFVVGSGVDNEVKTISIQSDGKIIIGGYFTSYNGEASKCIARLNADGTFDDTFDVGTGVEYAISTSAIQSDGKILIGGWFNSYNGVARKNIARLNADGTLDETFTLGTGANSTVVTIAILNNGKILIGGFFTSYNEATCKYFARLNADGTLDGTFNMGTGAFGVVYTTAIQGDGKIIIGGSFSTYNETEVNHIARINVDGTLDETFSMGTGAEDNVFTIAIQSDGNIIIGGNFTSFNETARNYIARINANGLLDESFAVGTEANDSVKAIAIQSDGKIIIGGSFNSYNGTARNRIARLNADGTLDPSFNPGIGASSSIYTTSIQSDGKIIIGGYFTSYNGTARNHIARLNANGTLDETFMVGTGANGTVFTTALQSDGKIIVGGAFTSYNGTLINCIARLNTDGTLDESFVVGTGASKNVLSIAIQSDGKIIIGGFFTSYNGASINRIARLNADGTLDETFTVGAGVSGRVHTTAIQSDGKIIIGGSFFSFNGSTRNRVARLNANGALDETFTVGTGTNDQVLTSVIQHDGKIIIGGNFTSYNGTAISRIVRLNTDGTLDETFAMGAGTGGHYPSVYAIALQSDGKILIGGGFTSYNGIGRNRIARVLCSNGTSLPQVDESDIMVYPNPTEGNAFIDMGEYCQSANVEVFDICGKLVMQKQYNNTQILDIDITAPAGIYFVTITTANKRETLKLIKN